MTSRPEGVGSIGALISAAPASGNATAGGPSITSSGSCRRVYERWRWPDSISRTRCRAKAASARPAPRVKAWDGKGRRGGTSGSSSGWCTTTTRTRSGGRASRRASTRSSCRSPTRPAARLRSRGSRRGDFTPTMASSASDQTVRKAAVGCRRSRGEASLERGDEGRRLGRHAGLLGVARDVAAVLVPGDELAAVVAVLLAAGCAEVARLQLVDDLGEQADLEVAPIHLRGRGIPGRAPCQQPPPLLTDPG